MEEKQAKARMEDEAAAEQFITNLQNQIKAAQKPVNPMSLLLPISAGLIFLIIGLKWGIDSWRTITGSMQAQGKVVAIDEGRRTKSPVVEYQVDGETYQARGVVGSNVFLPSIGETMTVLYDPAYPEAGTINYFNDMWAIPVTLCGIGLLITLISGYAFRRMRRQT
jgi:hypothetical protein